MMKYKEAIRSLLPILVVVMVLAVCMSWALVIFAESDDDDDSSDMVVNAEVNDAADEAAANGDEAANADNAGAGTAGGQAKNAASASASGQQTVDIDDQETPLAGGTWALANLILAAMTSLGGVLVLLRKGKDHEEDEYHMYKEVRIDYDRVNLAFAAKTAGGLAAIAAPVTFLITEDTKLAMVMTDRWTTLMLVILAVQIAAAVFNEKASKLGKGREDEAAREVK